MDSSNNRPCRLSAKSAAKENAEMLLRKANSYKLLSEFLEAHKDTIPKEVEELIWSLCIGSKGGYYS